MTQIIQLTNDVQLPPAIILHAGELTCMYELGKLRYIRKENTELLRTIYGAVRNQHWETLPYIIEEEQVEIGENAFLIQYTAIYRQGAPVYKARYRIEGKPDNSIVFRMEGIALAGFTKNRLGICIHHPIRECSGQQATITTPNGAVYTAQFPSLVNPQQPFTDIRHMQYNAAGDIRVELMFEGDIFETEDQRNWSDSSYKTYSTPLSVPFPVTVQPGDACVQQISVRATGGISNDTLAVSATREEKIPFPPLGYGASGRVPLTNDMVYLLQQIPFQHYRVAIDLCEAGWHQALQAALHQAGLLRTRLELVIFFPEQFDTALNDLLPLLQQQQQKLHSILVLQQGLAVTPVHLLAAVYPAMKKVINTVPVGYGTDLFFADLNRNRPPDIPFDFISFHLHPQVHANDSRTILENLENLPDLIDTATGFSNGKPVFVSPVTFSGRQGKAVPDEKQHSGLLAWWTLLSIQQLAGAGSLTYYQLLGEDGLLPAGDYTAGTASAIPASPLYHALVSIHQFEPMWIIRKYAGNRLLMDSLLLENAAGERLAFTTPHSLQSFNGLP